MYVHLRILVKIVEFVSSLCIAACSFPVQECLTLRQALLPEDSREVAETHFQIGTTHAVAGNLELAIAAFGGAVTTLKKHAKTLTAFITEKEKSQDESELEILRGSLKEVESLIPEVEKRKAEIFEDLQISKANPGTSALSSSAIITNGDRKPADDISHLIRKKRQVNEDAEVRGGLTQPNGEALSPRTKKIKVAEAADEDHPNGNRKVQPQVLFLFFFIVFNCRSRLLQKLPKPHLKQFSGPRLHLFVMIFCYT